MRAAQFKRGHVIRSQLEHMNVVYHKVSDTAVDIYGFRSMAKTMVHDIQTAMESVAAR
jgi:sarcosine oxidase subunit gamma